MLLPKNSVPFEGLYYSSNRTPKRVNGYFLSTGELALSKEKNVKIGKARWSLPIFIL